MKQTIVLIALIATIGCSKDNYDQPNATLSGRVVYKGEALNLEYNQVSFQLFQYGFGKTGPLTSVFAPDGTYSVLLFNGDYRLIIPNGQGPFKWKQLPSGAPDSTLITLNGNQEFDIEVTPYYMIRNPQLTAAGGTVTGKFSLEKIITDASARNIENVSLYINRTTIVSGANNIAEKTINASDITDINNVQVSVNVPNFTPEQNYVYARVGVKVAGVEDRLFSPVVKVVY